MVTSPYDAFDGVFVITLKERTDRQNHIVNLLRKLNIPFEFYYTERHPRGGVIGCFSSHVNVQMIALQRGYKNALIFEDDIIPTPSYDPKIIAHIGSFMQTHPNWEMIQLGYGIKGSQKHELESMMIPPLYTYNNHKVNMTYDSVSLLISKRVSKHLLQYCGLLTHAYCISEKAMRNIISLSSYELSKEHVIHYDIWLLTILNMNNCYATAPMLFDQQWCFETNNDILNLAEGVSRPVLCTIQNFKLLYLYSSVAAYREYIFLSTAAICFFIIYLIKVFKALK